MSLPIFGLFTDTYSFLLMEAAVGFGQRALHSRGLLAVLPHFGFDLPDVLVDLLTVIAPHHRQELTRRGFSGEVGRLGVNVRLHVARSWLDVTTTDVHGFTAADWGRQPHRGPQAPAE